MKKPDKIKYKDLAFFRFRKLGKDTIITNDIGQYAILKKTEFADFLHNRLEKKGRVYKELAQKNFIKKEIDSACLSRDYRSRKQFLSSGPVLHIVVVTMRCNQNCVYCHAAAKGMNEPGLDMTKKTADKVLAVIFDSPGDYLDIEFQGGEPLVNWPVVKYMVIQARKMNKKFNKDLHIKLVSNFSLMDEDKYRFLIEQKVAFCTSLDGPKELHDRNRPYMGGSSYTVAIKWIKRMNQEYPGLLKNKYIWKPGAITSVSRFSLDKPKEIVNEYLKLGYDTIFLRPLNPFGLSKKTWNIIGYNAKEYLDFYLKALDHVIGLNLGGTKMVERSAKFFVQKILTMSDPNHLELRSPCGAGIGQLAYNYNGNVYTCDEGRMLSMMGDENFKIGNVSKDSYKDIVTHPVVRTLCSASCLESLPGCSDCAYLPYCGTCPIYNYSEQGNIFGQMPNNDRCKINIATLDYLLKQLEDKKKEKIFRAWLKM